MFPSCSEQNNWLEALWRCFVPFITPKLYVENANSSLDNWNNCLINQKSNIHFQVKRLLVDTHEVTTPTQARSLPFSVRWQHQMSLQVVSSS